MREISFRGKQEDNGEWVYGAYYHQTEFYGDDCDYHYIISSCDELEDNMMCFDGVIPETVGQFTGLTDKNGKKIFEGDIVRCKYANTPANEHIQKVVFYDGKFMAEFSQGGCYAELYDGATHFSFDKSVYMTEIEVIGNIHDNPELLGGDY